MSAKRVSQRRGPVLLFTGDGKGKTTAAMGQALRLAGRRQRVLILQFAKTPGSSGEQRAFRRLAPLVTLKALGKGWLDLSARPRRAEDIDQVGRSWEQALRLIRSRKWDAVILDEVAFVVSAGFLAEEKVTGFLDARPAAMTVVMTGRGKPRALVACADYVTEMKKLKHPFDKGASALAGIEY